MGFLPCAENDGVGGGMVSSIKGILEFWREVLDEVKGRFLP
jgi:hypothetical protein